MQKMIFIYYLIIYITFLIQFSTSAFTPEEKKKYISSLKPIFEKLNIIPNKNNQIDQKDTSKLIRYIFGGLVEQNVTVSTPAENEFIFNIMKELLHDQPDMIEVEKLPDILDPEKLERISNEMLKDFRMDKLEKDIKARTEQKRKKMKEEKKKKKKEEKPKEDLIDL